MASFGLFLEAVYQTMQLQGSQYVLVGMLLRVMGKVHKLTLHGGLAA